MADTVAIQIGPRDHGRLMPYWILDPQERRALALTRHGDRWRERKLTEQSEYHTPLLPGFVLRLADAFAVLRTP